MIASLVLAAGLAGLEPPVQADLKCVAVFALAAGDDNAEAKKNQAGVVGGMMYYLGRIDGRHPGVDLQAGLTELLLSPGFFSQLPAEAKRCGAEMEAKGNALVGIGGALKSLAGKAPPPSK